MHSQEDPLGYTAPSRRILSREVVFFTNLTLWQPKGYAGFSEARHELLGRALRMTCHMLQYKYDPTIVKKPRRRRPSRLPRLVKWASDMKMKLYASPHLISGSLDDPHHRKTSLDNGLRGPNPLINRLIAGSLDGCYPFPLGQRDSGGSLMIQHLNQQ